MRILVVDDNTINRLVAKHFLESLNCMVDQATNGEDAVAACGENQYDLVLMDWHMPVMDGLAATAYIRKREAITREPRLPIIALTANVGPGCREECLGAGMDDYITKPVFKETLAQVLARWAGTGAARNSKPEV